MRVSVVPCGPTANESERRAIEHLKDRLQKEPGKEEWILLTNLAFSVTHQLQSDEIDVVAIGPPGVRVIEVKHWGLDQVKTRLREVELEADRVTGKARKIGTTLRRHAPDLPYVAGAFLLTQEAAKVRGLADEAIRGVRLHPLAKWKDALGLGDPPILSPLDVKRLCQILEPRSAVAIDGSLRLLAGYVNLEHQSPRQERFHRVYKGIHPTRRDRVVLHLYDLSASDDKDPETKARREFDALHRLQLHPWAPRILDSFQDAPGYEGEMAFFTFVDPAAPSLQERSEDSTWTTASRAEFARNAVSALRELHRTEPDGQPLVHRNLTPRTILVWHDNSPILTGFERTKIPSDLSVASGMVIAESDHGVVAPEVLSQGLAVADCRSDVYSLCASLAVLFRDGADPTSRRALEILEKGTPTSPDERALLDNLGDELSNLLGVSVPAPAVPPAHYWTEGQTIVFRKHEYRILDRLGSGGVGAVFKVVQTDRFTQEDVGTYIAKVVFDGSRGARILASYTLAKSHLSRVPSLSTIFEVADHWEENGFVALLSWIEGAPLAEFIGLFQLLAEEQGDASPEAVAVDWITRIGQGLKVLHDNGLIHGDVSARNLIVSGCDLVLTDFDFVTKIGNPITAPGTVLYSSPTSLNGESASPSDDLYALAASFFHVLFDREPFRHGGEISKQRGLNWEGLDRTTYPLLAEFFDRATHPDAGRRFDSVDQALVSLKPPRPMPTTEADPEPASTPEPSVSIVEQSEQHVDWLRSLLQSYPGSRWGNRETRGLDSPFAADTYVETALEKTLLEDIRGRRVRLVILCGNAGDGKTALLQHLAQSLGLEKQKSAEGILKGKLSDGLVVKMNLDGSASWKGRSADELLDEFMAPFQAGPPGKDVIHLLAINDGRLLEWIEGHQQRNGGETALTSQLAELLEPDAKSQESHIRFISLNERSLVGDIPTDSPTIKTAFLEGLVDQLYGGEKARETWTPCLSCSAKDRCQVFRAAGLFGPPSIPFAGDEISRQRARQRLFEALQAVHLRGETHITVRELRAALVYILFGIDFCDDYHRAEGDKPLPYWDRAFEAGSPARQGDLLRDLAHFDPALEAHPQVDRNLISPTPADESPRAPHYADLSLASARRRAFFEWTESHLTKIADDVQALDLARGRHLRLFRDLPLMKPEARDKIRERLCKGITRLEDLPPRALDRPAVVPLRVTPRTPTETAFWVEKPLASFRLDADFPDPVPGIERLHRQASLVYRYRDGREETLRMGAELFHLLLELSDGYQLGDVTSDDAFANLSIFVQRLVQEDARELFAWNPIADESIFQVAAKLPDAENGRQSLVLTRLTTGAVT